MMHSRSIFYLRDHISRPHMGQEWVGFALPSIWIAPLGCVFWCTLVRLDKIGLAWTNWAVPLDLPMTREVTPREDI
jgi:hypothetical protein